MTTTRIAVTPASSLTAYSLIQHIGDGLATGTDEEIEIVLHDEENNSDRLHGNAMEIMDCAYPLVKGVSATCSWQHALSGVDMLIVLPFVPSSRHNTRAFIRTHKTSPSVWHAQSQMKVVFVGTQGDLRDFLTINPMLSKETLLFVDISETIVRPMSLSYKLSNDIRQWWSNRHQHKTSNLFEETFTVSEILDWIGGAAECDDTVIQTQPPTTRAHEQELLCASFQDQGSTIFSRL